MATGKITQIIGAVVDVEFPREAIPKIYEALKLVDVDLTLDGATRTGVGELPDFRNVGPENECHLLLGEAFQRQQQEGLARQWGDI